MMHTYQSGRSIHQKLDLKTKSWGEILLLSSRRFEYCVFDNDVEDGRTRSINITGLVNGGKPVGV
jgi:hypothetical protein